MNPRPLLAGSLLALTLLAPVRAEGDGGRSTAAPAEVRGILRFLDLPSDEPEAAGLGPLTPDEVLRRLRAIGPLGEAVLAGVAASGYRTLHVLCLRGPRIPPRHHALLRRLDGPWGDRSVSREDLGSWRDNGEEGLILLHLDRIAEQRREGWIASPASTLAHELVHVVQAANGSLDRRRDEDSYHDYWDEAEAELVCSLVLRQELAAAGRLEGLSPDARAYLEAASGATRRALRAVYGLQEFDHFSGLFRGRRNDPVRYDPARDPFALLPEE